MGKKWEVYHQTDDSNNLMFCVLSRDGLNARIIGMSFTQKEEAQLLAASPLMLKALENTLAWMRDDLGLDDDSPEVAPVIAAIKAAEGE